MTKQTSTKTKITLLIGTAFEGESNAAIMACNDFLRLRLRSVRALALHYAKGAYELASHKTPHSTPDSSSQKPPLPHKTPQNPATCSSEGEGASGPRRNVAPPTTSYHTLREWSEKFDWQGRAILFDDSERAKRKARRSEVMNQGLALDYERIKALKELSEFLYDQIYEQTIEKGRVIEATCPCCAKSISITNDDAVRPLPRLWLLDVKQVGTGQNTERVDLEKFNGPLLAAYRQSLDDLAKEMGDRQKGSQTERKIQDLYQRLEIDTFSEKQRDMLINPRGHEWYEILLDDYLHDDLKIKHGK